MSLLQRSLLLLSFHVLSSCCVSSGTFVVTQSPDVLVTEGKSTNITCCWTEMFERFRVHWLKNQTVIYRDNVNNLSQSQGSQKNCSSLNFSNIKTEDSGTYICKVTVEVPTLTEVTGSGTFITVKRTDNTGNTNSEKSKAPEEEMFIYLMRTLPILALIITFFWLYYVGTKAQQNSQASSGNKPTSSQKQEQDEEEEERDERAVEAASE